MKSHIVIILICIIAIVTCFPTEEELIIPQDAIRFRIIASSNTVEDQQQKQKVKEVVDHLFQENLANIKTKEQIRKKLSQLLPELENKIAKILGNHDFSIHYGNNYFPEKTYRGFTYPEGNYESLVITIGEGQGDNWWCVLFPPLCLLSPEEENTSDIEYRLYIQEILEQFLN